MCDSDGYFETQVTGSQVAGNRSQVTGNRSALNFSKSVLISIELLK